jgi:four helix bundle protein
MLFRDLKAYQHALRVAALSRPLIKRLPESEHDLADQWRRASNSIALNLAEGVTRKGSFVFLCRILPSLLQKTVKYFT